MNPSNSITDIVLCLENWVSKNNYSGYDPYDGLRSQILQWLPLPGKYSKIAWIQFFKLCPVNLRPLFFISKGRNPKGMGLFLSSYVKLFKATEEDVWKQKAIEVAEWLKENSSIDFSNYCWGYNFDWQSRSFFIPKGTPTVVNTSFIGHAYLDLFEITQEKKWLDIAGSSCDFIIEDLNRYETEKHLCFSYTPIDQTRVHNASILGAGLLARYSNLIQENNFDLEIQKASKYLLDHQLESGAWVYAETEYQKWIDSFHTGFNLMSLRYIQRLFPEDDSITGSIQKGELFYESKFFLKDGTPKYYHNKIYPIDIHSAAMGIKYFSQYNLQLAANITNWMINNMLDTDGYFYFRKGKYFINKIPYVRWSQAWAFYGFTELLICRN